MSADRHKLIPNTATIAGNNVWEEVKDSVLIVYVDLSVNLGVSKSGKSHLVGTTQGGRRLSTRPDVAANITVYKPF